ncbi:hypothetical protein PGTDC60_1661 [Porphyromonas gingivalis TDC60]|nr:hypothetical protein PGTDC60_1661 [Porphyromonas gingivalis TDC60]
MAPNYFHADPQQFKHRIVKEKSFSSYSNYEYGVDNRLQRIYSVDESSGEIEHERRFFFNEGGYMIREEEYDGTIQIPVRKWEFVRDDKGYITHFSRYSPKDGSQELIGDLCMAISVYFVC